MQCRLLQDISFVRQAVGYHGKHDTVLGTMITLTNEH